MSKQKQVVRGPTYRYVAYCVEPGCRCVDRAGVIVGSPAEAPAGYEVRREIVGGTYHGMTPAEVQRIFNDNGCGGFWKPEYATLYTHTLIELLKAKNDRRLIRLIGGLTRANR